MPTTRPSIILPLLTLVFLPILSAVILSGGVALERHISLKKLDESITKRDQRRADRYFYVFDRSSSLIEKISALVYENNKNRGDSANYRAFFYRLAAKENLRDPETLDRLLTEIKESLSLTTLPRRDELIRLLNAVATSYELKESYSQQILELTDKLRQTKEAHRLLSLDLSRIFSLSSAYDEGEQMEIYAYKEGILAGLPRLKQLPDSIADLTTLRQLVDRSGGKVTIVGENAAEEFSVAINSLKEASVPLIQEWNKSLQAREDASVALQEAEGKFFTQGQSVTRFVIGQLKS